MDNDIGLKPSDFDLIMSVLHLNHSMESAAHGVKLIEKLLSYPIDSLDDLRDVFQRPPSKDGVAKVGRHKVKFEDAARFIGSDGFPIENREQLISRIVLGFEASRMDMLDQAAQVDTGQVRIENE